MQERDEKRRDLRHEAKEPPEATARALIRTCARATLASVLRRDFAVGWPYASLVLVACRPDATPILLLSDLADHSKNIMADDRVSLLFDGTEGLEEPLAGTRLTLVGHARETTEPSDRALYLARHPSAARYAGFKDFRFYRIDAVGAHLVAGFGRIHWLDAKDVLGGGPPAARAG